MFIMVKGAGAMCLRKFMRCKVVAVGSGLYIFSSQFLLRGTHSFALNK